MMSINDKKKQESKEIVILHGWGSSASKWEGFIAELTKDGFLIHIFDLPGLVHESLSEPWNLDNYVDFVKRYLEEQGIAAPVIIGHSFGGRVALKFAWKYPQLCPFIILLSAAGLKPKDCLSRLKRVLFQKIAKAGNALLPWEDGKDLAKKFLYTLSGNHDYRLVSTDAMRKTLQNILSEDLESIFAEITVPTYIIWGEKDRITPLSHGKVMQQKIRDSYLEILPGMGHAPYLAHPEIVVHAIKNAFTWYHKRGGG